MDSRNREQTPTKERRTAKTIQLRQEFAFFDKPVPSDKEEIVETADIADREQLIGAIVGRIFPNTGERISANGMHVEFTIHKKEDEVNTVPSISTPTRDPFGARFETPVIYMTFPSGRKYASLGVRQQSGSISFTDWVEVDKDVKEDKNKIKQQVQNRKAQPRSFRLHELAEAKYKIT